ncbi:hypothetical protein [Nocardia sp. N2S4-5]|uniref:hypothetical protein n=1 Tax=Nocardia sp. N2S4-5 TaxID=3351565 RepID=UPI0037D2AFD2
MPVQAVPWQGASAVEGARAVLWVWVVARAWVVLWVWAWMVPWVAVRMARCTEAWAAR